MKQYAIQAASGAELVGVIETAVAAGELAPGERLPSVRRLAAEVGLSPGTIAASFAELRRRGIVVSEPRRGVRVGPAPPLGSSRRLLSVRRSTGRDPFARRLAELTVHLRAAVANT